MRVHMTVFTLHIYTPNCSLVWLSASFLMKYMQSHVRGKNKDKYYPLNIWHHRTSLSTLHFEGLGPRVAPKDKFMDRPCPL
jgi:hypothetical protein